MTLFFQLKVENYLLGKIWLCQTKMISKLIPYQISSQRTDRTNFDFGNRYRFNLNGATVILFLRANLHGKEVTTTNYLFSQNTLWGEEKKEAQGPSINNVGNWEGGRVKIGQNCRRILPTWGRGCQKYGKNADVVYGWTHIRPENFS